MRLLAFIPSIKRKHGPLENEIFEVFKWLDHFNYLSFFLKYGVNQWNFTIYMRTRIEKSIARFLAIMLAPECGEIMKTIRAKRNGWIKMPDELELLRKNSGLGDTYVLLYEAEPHINFW